MFTGIIEEVGAVAELKRGGETAGGARLVIRARQGLLSHPVAHPATAGRAAGQGVGGQAASGDSKLQEGESIAVNGVCLTARQIAAETFSADLSPETLDRSNLGVLSVGSRVNLERAMTPSTRFGGHIVQGHVDGVGKLVALDPLLDGNYWLSVDVPAEIERYIVWKGSISLNGISLTVARLDGLRVGVAIIPHTYENTNLCDLHAGDSINVECDVLAKYVEKLLATIEAGSPTRRSSHKPSAISLERFLEEGF